MMSLGNREGRATMKQSRKTYRISYAGALWCAPLHPAMDRTAGFFRVKMQPSLPGRFFAGVQRMYVYGMEEQQ